MVLAITGVSVANTYLSMPKNPKQNDSVLQLLLQARRTCNTRAPAYIDRGIGVRLAPAESGSVSGHSCPAVAASEQHGAPAQEFAWTEADMPRVKAERSASLEGEAVAKIATEPVFCFEVGSESALRQ